jgi:PAS domain S-box-containing protein
VTTFPILDESKTILALGSIWTDITQRKRDEEALRQAAEDLGTAQRVAHVGSFRLDTRTQQVTWSEELYRIFGLDPSKPRTVPLYLDPEGTALSDETKARLRAAIDKTAADGSPYELEFAAKRPDGSIVWVAARGEAIRDEAGQVSGVAGTCTDVTKLKALERLRDEWTSVIAHDLRQPIGTVLMASDLLPNLRENALSEEEQKLAGRIHSAGETLRRMVDDLLDMSLLESDRLKLDREPTNAADLVRQTVERLAHVKGIERVRVVAEPGLPPVFVDSMRMGQVIGNLVSNAIKYGDPDTEVSIGVARAADEVEIAVTNHGSGIPEDELPRLFNRFMRSRRTRGSGVPGLGLGLYIAQGIVQAHGGSLAAASVPGETTTFTMRLPVSSEQRQAA